MLPSCTRIVQAAGTCCQQGRSVCMHNLQKGSLQPPPASKCGSAWLQKPSQASRICKAECMQALKRATCAAKPAGTRMPAAGPRFQAGKATRLTCQRDTRAPLAETALSSRPLPRLAFQESLEESLVPGMPQHAPSSYRPHRRTNTGSPGPAQPVRHHPAAPQKAAPAASYVVRLSSDTPRRARTLAAVAGRPHAPTGLGTAAVDGCWAPACAAHARAQQAHTAAAAWRSRAVSARGGQQHAALHRKQRGLRRAVMMGAPPGVPQCTGDQGLRQLLSAAGQGAVAKLRAGASLELPSPFDPTLPELFFKDRHLSV